MARPTDAATPALPVCPDSAHSRRPWLAEDGCAGAARSAVRGLLAPAPPRRIAQEIPGAWSASPPPHGTRPLPCARTCEPWLLFSSFDQEVGSSFRWALRSGPLRTLERERGVEEQTNASQHEAHQVGDHKCAELRRSPDPSLSVDAAHREKEIDRNVEHERENDELLDRAEEPGHRARRRRTEAVEQQHHNSGQEEERVVVQEEQQVLH